MVENNGDEKQVGRTDTETAATLQKIAKALDETFNPLVDNGAEGENVRSTGFCLLVFGFNAPGISNYVSNANRQDMIKALKETVKRLEGNEDNVKTEHPDDVKEEG